MNLIKRLLNSVTMYRLVLYCLLVLTALSFAYSLFGWVSYSIADLALALLNLVLISFVSNQIFGRMLRAPINQESWLITALILFLILPPASSLNEHLVLAAVGAISMLSKYLLAFRHKHFFNPAAFGALVAGMAFSYYAFWWVGSLYYFPVTLVMALLVFAKIRRFHMLIGFLITSLVVITIYTQVKGVDFLSHLDVTLRSWPLFFFAGIMLTEPYTTPAIKRDQIIYACIVAAFSSWPFVFGPVYSSPELALLIGNIFVAIVSFQPRFILKLKEKKKLSKSAYEFIFESDKEFSFQAGQYMEWTLPHKNIDSRGIRRFFTISSSPQDKTLHLGVKFNKPSSSFKKSLQALETGDTICGGEITGDFVLPKNKNKDLCFIAGGIGITPFISHLRALIDQNSKAKITLFYGNRSMEEIAYIDFLNDAQEKLDLKVVHTLPTLPDKKPKGLIIEEGRISKDLIQKYVTNCEATTFYISGPSAMVDYFKDNLKPIGINSSQIKTDYFPGFA